MPAEPEDTEAAQWDGPDPREWPAHSGIWDRVLDIENLARADRALAGSSAQVSGPAYDEARRFVTQLGQQLRGQLAMEILAAYGITASDGEDPSPFARAGKPRAFGPESQPPPATL